LQAARRNTQRRQTLSVSHILTRADASVYTGSADRRAAAGAFDYAGHVGRGVSQKIALA
jgi:hypothetical protein